MDSPLVSITVTTFQHVKFIAKCLDSLLAQDLGAPYEILIGEDGSTDGTREVCINYAEKYPERIRLFLNSGNNKITIDGSPTGRRNILDLIHAAKGKYIANCEGDDFWISQNKLSAQVAILEAHPDIAGSYHDTILVDEAGKTQDLFRRNLRDSMNVDDLVGLWSPFHYTSFMFRKSDDPTGNPIYERVASFDFLLFIETACKGELRKVPEIMSAYRKHEGGVTSTGLHRSQRLHLHRMWMWSYILTTDFGEKKKIKRLILEHFGQICAVSSGKKEKLRYLKEYRDRAQGGYKGFSSMLLRMGRMAVGE